MHKIIKKYIWKLKRIFNLSMLCENHFDNIYIYFLFSSGTKYFLATINSLINMNFKTLFSIIHFDTLSTISRIVSYNLMPLRIEFCFDIYSTKVWLLKWNPYFSFFIISRVPCFIKFRIAWFELKNVKMSAHI